MAMQRRRWGGCWGGLSCFGSQKGGKRVVPASRIPEGNASAPPSSPASFTNSTLPSTAQSPSCFLSVSANSPGGSSNVSATGPYAHETQLVSPPVFSTFTTEPSTAPFTPPPELNHLTTPSSPDVPFALTFSSAMDLKGTSRSSYVTANALQATYPLYPESPASSLISPISGTSGDCLSSFFPEREFRAKWAASISAQDSFRSSSSRLFGLDTGTVAHPIILCCLEIQPSSTLPLLHNFIWIRLGQVFPGKQMFSRVVEMDIITGTLKVLSRTLRKLKLIERHLGSVQMRSTQHRTKLRCHDSPKISTDVTDRNQSDNEVMTDEDDIFSKLGSSRINKRYQLGLSSSDAEIDYRRGRTLRERKGDLSWRN
ncbi:hypothetical protein IFM89_031195 [Coptis chinensis]|uniref:Uncharacterized protein n=1 Tax=Coptis chinensis TaxID=261450 RepID=A0A835ITI3_9MAGN|nr:hypothetical protein IFM89_031195 [Coptis chinensis]